MAILKFDKRLDFTNRFTLHPSRSFTSSKDGSVTGSIRLSHVKEGRRLSLRNDQYADQHSTAFDEVSAVNQYESALTELTSSIAAAISDGLAEDFSDFFYSETDDTAGLIGTINQMVSDGVATYGPDKKTFQIKRFTPYLETTFLSRSSAVAGDAALKISIASTGSYRKNMIRKLYYPQHAGIFRKCDWAYSNAHTINFFTASSVNANTAVIYPDPTGSDGTAQYRPDKGFTFEFFINPRYTTDSDADEFNAGTILHYSSTYALSLVSGSSRGIDGKPDGFRLMLQLSSSADTNPSSIDVDGSHGSGVDDVYFSSDNSLSLGSWHHVAVRWGGLSGVSPVQEGTGSFVIDGVEDTTFVIPSASITAPPGSTSFVGINDREDANALFIGNYFDGTNASSNAVAGFFNSNASTNEGVLEIQGAAGSLTSDPSTFGFTNKLNAELHEIRVFKEFRDTKQIQTHMGSGFSSEQFVIEKSGSLAFYVPPFFVMEAPERKKLDKPFTLSTYEWTSRTPFNVTASFGSEMFDLNAPNFFREFVAARYPRFFNLTGSTSYTVDDNPANQQLLQDGQITARNLLILPNDNGSFTPGYDLLKTGTFTQQPATESLLRSFVNDRGVTDLSIITLNRMLGGTQPIKYSGPLGDELYGPHYPDTNVPETAFVEAFYNDREFEGSDGPFDIDINSERKIGNDFRNLVYTDNRSPAFPSLEAEKTEFYVFEATGDESSNQAVFFNIPNVFYGKRIKPGTLVLRDPGVTGSNGKMSMTLKDDGFGSLYRANSSNPNKLHSVGNVFYDQGIVAIKSPHLFQFGSGSFEIGFKGTQDMFNREMLIEAPKSLLNSSSNPTFQKLAPSDDANETADEFVYITTVLLHDDDLNVIGRATLSQPIVKRVTDGITFRLKKDF